MSLQTYVLENDEWVSRTVSADELLRDNTAARRKTGRQSLSKSPTCGILTKTIVESPVIRWVLPVQLRSARYNDVALIGDHCVQICELGRDRQLQDVVSKKDFGSRIRNAVVMGSPQYSRKASETAEDNIPVKAEDSDTEMAGLGATGSGSPYVNLQLPPQLLVLVLEKGDLVFLFLQKGPARSWVFVSSTHKVPGQRLVYPGFHMAIDPSSSFLALGCAENLFIMYQLESMDNLQAQYLNRQPLQPIKKREARSVKGIIHKIEFLHPTHGNEVQVILMIIIVQPDASKLAIYEWENTSDLRKVFSEERKGYRLDEDYRLPLLVVPLKVRNAFLIITERITATCSDILSGPPTFVQFELANREDTELHHGTREPLWTAWTRPIRHPPYHDRKDVIYLAREDGLINFLECGDESEIETSVSMGSVDCNIDTAFASLFHLFGDVLVTGGDSGPGAVWNVQARQSPQRIGSIPNWSPTVDFVVTNDGMLEDSTESSSSSVGKMVPYQPDRIFACSGRGITGAITQFRYGLQARIGLDLTYPFIVRQCWAISDLDLDEDMERGFFLLLALPNASSILHLSGDLSEASEKDQDATPYDLTSTTLAVQEANGAVVQITANYITIVTPAGCYQSLTSDVIRDHTAVVADVAIEGSTIALAVYTGSDFRIILLKIVGLEVSVQRTFDVEGEVTCIAMGSYAGSLVVLAGLQQGRDPTLAIYPAELEQQSHTEPLLLKLLPNADTSSHNVANSWGPSAFGALTSIVNLGERFNKAVIVAGTKDGDVLTIKLNESLPGSHEIYRDRLSPSPSRVYSGAAVGDPNAILVCSDAELVIMTSYVTDRQGGHFEEIYRVWPTDGDRPNTSSPPINAVASLHEQLPEFGNSVMVMVSGSRIMVTELQRQPKPVPRYFPVYGTPVKILYSKRLEALITVVSKNGSPSLHFLDRETGHDLSLPLERKKLNEAYNYHEVDYITGLGNPDTRAISLTTWTYRNGGVRGDWIVLAMRRKDNEGLLLIISAESENVSTETNGSRRIRFWTKFDRKIRDGPIWSAATDEHGVFLCVGEIIQYHVIEQGKFKISRQYQLPSPASWMEVVNGRLHAITTNHSLMVLDYKSDWYEEDEQMTELHTDAICRHSLHAIEIGTILSPITLLSDRICGIHGLWAPDEDERPLSLLFGAELQASIRRFARGYTRAVWGSIKNRPRYGCLPTGITGSDIIGLTIDGSLQHFSLLNEDAWRFLRFIQNLAIVSPLICPHAFLDWTTTEISPEPEMYPRIYMHVDGDVLQRCRDKRVLEELASKPQDLKRFRELIKPLDEDGYLPSTPGPDDNQPFFELAYSILKYYLAPVLS
ncbi:hypothetical protein F4804DRAFT_258489 [Jackrogersella minutella]|nr:hypothetical protein F4804DRAFT_258489 [Jackrogersella minutella]